MDIEQLLQMTATRGGPASEDTLKELARSLGKDGGDSILKATTKSFGGVIKTADALTGAVGTATKAIVDFANERRKVSQVVSELTGNIPVFRGVGKAGSVLLETLENNQTAFNTLSQAGIFAGKRFSILSRDAAALGLTTEELGKAFAVAGGDIRRLGLGGLEYAINQASMAFDANAESLMKFGMSFDEINEKFLTFLNQNSFAMRLYGRENVNLTEGSKRYSIFLRRLAELTGDQVDEAEDQLKKARTVNAYDAFIQSIQDPQTREKYDRIVAAYGQMYGDQGREAAMAILAGMNPLTEGSQRLVSMVNGLAGDIQGARNMANNNAMSMDRFTDTMLNDVFSRTRGLRDTFGQQGMLQLGIQQALTGGIDEFGVIFGAMKKGTATEEEIAEIRKRIIEKQDDNLNELTGLQKKTQETRKVLQDTIAQLALDSKIFQGAVNTMTTALNLANVSLERFLKDIPTAKDVTEGKGDSATQDKQAISTVPTDNPIEEILKNAVMYLLDIKEAIYGLLGKKFEAALNYTEMAEIQKTLANDPSKLKELDSIKDLMKMYMEDQNMTPEAAQKATIEAIKAFANNPKNNYQGAEALDKLFEKNQGTIKLYNKGTMGFGKLFENFGGGKLAMLHGEEAVVPKNSPIGGMLDMMSGDLANMKGTMFKDGKLNVGGMIEQGQAMGAKYDTYANENKGAIQSQAENFAKSLGVPQNMIDEAKNNPVKSNNAVNTSTNNISNSSNFGPSKKLDELIRVNKQMLDAIRNM